MMINWDSIELNKLVEKPLSEREFEILYYLVKGWSAKAIGEYVGISKRTVEHYSENIKAKFHTTTKSAVINRIIDHLITPPASKNKES